MKLLIIDDDKNLQIIYRQLFLAAGHEVQTSNDGLSGISSAVDFQPDVILLDLMMPEMDGFEFISTLKNNTSMSPMIVVCSNLSQQSDIDQAYRAGADSYLKKSDFIGTTLVEAVEKVFNERPKGAMPQQPSTEQGE